VLKHYIKLVNAYIMQVKAEKVISWMDSNLPPLSWRVISIKQMKLLLKHNISPTAINSATYFNDEILDSLKVQIKADYNMDLPNF
jgi:hypothetical protein